MASLCKSQQCSIERRGFRQELDSWRHKLIHCVGFETILEGLFGPALLNDLSLFKDCEPTGVCDWSFDENCLFCCLRREKVKEHLAGFHKQINEPGQENFLKQEQAKIIRLERQAEEFINAVFYKKDSPRISDPNIPLVAREIMQRMIRQFAAEYTSKNSSTQDSSPPNSTKNQSLPKSPTGQSSPPPATTQNPVLSKLLMADQDSPLDLTVKKPPSEEPCEQADGVLDLSTKKSPCSGSPNSSTSPSTSNTIGNGTQDTERKAIEPNNSTSLSLEMFMAKLCSQHQKQFILVLNNLCTEESIMKSKSRSASVSEIENANIEDYDHSCSDRKANLSFEKTNKSVSESFLNCHISINTPADQHEDNYYHKESHCSDYPFKVPMSSDSKEDHAIIVSHATDQTITGNPVGIPSTEENTETIFAKMSEVSQAVIIDHGVLSHSNSALNMLNDSLGSELLTDVPKMANKENTQYINPKQTLLDCNDCKLKQENSVTTVAVKKLGNFCESPFQNLSDHSGSALQKVRLLENKRLKTVKCKNTRVLMTNDCDKHCDVVYISEPITTECHFENQKSIVCPRNTARKSTRGYLISSDCCELSTVRTLVRSSKVEGKENSTLHVAEALIPNGLIETLPSTDVVSLIHVEEKKVEMETFNPVPQNDEMKERVPDSSQSSESENSCDQCLAMAKEHADNASNSMTAVFALAQDKAEKVHVPSNHIANELALNEHVDEIPKTKLNSKVTNIDAHVLPVNDHEYSKDKFAIDPGFDVCHSNNSCFQEKSLCTPSLDMEAIVSLKNNHKLSTHDTTPSECYPPNTAMEEASTTLQYSNGAPSTEYSSSLPNGIGDKDLPHIGSSSLTKILLEDSSEAVITNPAVPSDQQLLIYMSSETISDILTKEKSDGQICNTSQVDLSSSGSEIQLHENSVQNQVIENAQLDLKTLENVKDGLSLAPNDSVEMGTKDALVPESIDNLWPLLGDLNCRTPDTLRPVEHFYSPLNICAKVVGNINVKLEADVSNEDLHHYNTVSLSGCNTNDICKVPLKTKEVNEGSNSGAVNLDKIDISVISTKNTSNPLPPSKRHKKVPAPTDRCLRSREVHGDSSFQKMPSLQVLLSYDKDTNLAQRSVELKTENTPCAAATVIDSFVDEISDEENLFAVSLNSHCKEGKPLLNERILKRTCSSPFMMSKNLNIYVKIDSDNRIVSLANKNHNCLSIVDAECKCAAASLRNTCPLQLQKCNKGLSENVSKSISRTKSSTKHVALKTLKDQMKNCKSGKLKNMSIENKQKKGSNKQVNRPKFIDWCSEEENRERISNFNDKYTTVHKNWIPLERETANVAKSKSKADKLKEIWKTKRRARRLKSVQDAPKCSPMQMLFTNSFTLSDVCRWFMETTETKSLVIVKKINTRLPEEHQLPMIQSPKYSSQSLYPYTLQAQRLKKHLKKFASVSPAPNDLKTQNSLNKLISNSSAPLNQAPTDAVKEPNDCKKQEPHVKAKKPAPVHILQKYNRLRENLKFQSSTINKTNKVCVMNGKSKACQVKNVKEMSSSELQKVSNSLTSKSLVKNQKRKKHSKNDSLMQSVSQPNKKRKIEAKQGFFKNRPRINKDAVITKTKAGKLSKIDLTKSNSQAPKKQLGNAGVYKTGLRKGKAKTPMQKQSLKSQLVLKRQTRSSKRRQVSPNLSDSPKITSLSSSDKKKELHKKLHTVSAKNKINVASHVRHHKPRSQLQPPSRKGRSLEFK